MYKDFKCFNPKLTVILWPKRTSCASLLKTFNCLSDDFIMIPLRKKNVILIRNLHLDTY